MSSNQKQNPPPSSSASSSDKSQTKKTICKTKSTGSKPASISSTGFKSSFGSSKSQTKKTICKTKSSGSKPASTSSTGSKSSSGSDKSLTKTICKMKSSGSEPATTSSIGPKSSSGTSKSQTTKTKAKSSGVKSVDGKDGQKLVRSQPNSKATKSSSVRPEPKAVPTLKEERQDGPENTRETVKQVSSPTTCLTLKVKSNPSKPVTSDMQDGPQSDEDNIDSSLTFMGSKSHSPSYAGVHHSSSKDRCRKANIRANANPSPPNQMAQAKVDTEEARKLAFEQQIANMVVRLNDPQAEATVAAPTGKQANPTRPKSFGKDGKGNK